MQLDFGFRVIDSTQPMNGHSLGQVSAPGLVSSSQGVGGPVGGGSFSRNVVRLALVSIRVCGVWQEQICAV